MERGDGVPPRRLEEGLDALRRRERAVDQAIREAIERGDFGGLSGEGRPLAEDPLPQDEQWAARNLLRTANAVPEWLDARKDIEREHARIVAMARRHVRWLDAREARLRETPADRILEAVRLTDDADRRFMAQLRERVADLARSVRQYNLKVPSVRLHLPLPTPERVLEEARRT